MRCRINSEQCMGSGQSPGLGEEISFKRYSSVKMF